MDQKKRLITPTVILGLNTVLILINSICLLPTLAMTAYLGWTHYKSQQPSNNIPGLTSSVVQISALYKNDEGRLEPVWIGSGSIISADGLILTNAHVAMPDRFNPIDVLQISMTKEYDEPSKPAYYARLLQADPRLDLAVLQIDTDLNQKPVDRSQLKLNPIPLGNSDNLELGDTLVILGYPDIGGDTITMTRGEVSGFTNEAPFGQRAFIKTSGSITGGNSGGLAADVDGKLVGIPTQVGYGRDDQVIDCRQIADTNHDGVIDEQDACIAIGGFINALRPVKLALPLIEAAKKGEINIAQASTKNATLPSGRDLLFEDDFSNPNSGWMIENEIKGAARYQDGEYIIEVKSDKYLYWSLAGKSYGDAVIGVNTRILHSTGYGDYGVICRYQDSNNFYLLEITEDGYYGIARFENGNYIWLQQWDASPLLAVSTQNTIHAACIGDTLTLGVNGDTLTQVRDTTFKTGDIGLMAGTWDDPGLVVAFDNLEVRAP